MNIVPVERRCVTGVGLRRPPREIAEPYRVEKQTVAPA
jgi:hypothetical protein